jgi:predicted AlkP superfamily phosphohydrolase/phosphomutase
MTGKNPGKHGIFNFNEKPYGTYYLDPVISTDIKSTTLWEYISN